MKTHTIASPNFSDTIIQPKFLVLHYTACDLTRTLEIFTDRERKVCAHFVIAPNGDLYDLGGFWDGQIRQGAHAGVSEWNWQGMKYERLNTCSIGIEIVNLNGNLFPYTDAQYETLAELTRHLIKRFPELENPERAIGHEHIAGFRGKVDPGYCFDWQRFFRSAYATAHFPARPSLLQAGEINQLQKELAMTSEEKRTPDFWMNFSSALESRTAQTRGRS